MHPQAHDFVAQHARPSPGLRVLDIGGQNMNGTVRGLFPGAEYLSLDIADGPGVDIVADAAEWEPSWVQDSDGFDVVVCCEVFEHTPYWQGILQTAHDALRPGGLLIATMAGPGRPEHSGRQATGGPAEGEHYANIDPGDLGAACMNAGFLEVDVDVAGGSTDPARLTEDVRVTARRPVNVHLLTAVYGGYDTEILGHTDQLPPVNVPSFPVLSSFALVTDVAGSAELGETAAGFREGKIYPEVVLAPPSSDDPRQSARWPKFLPHLVPLDWYADGDVVIWMDGRVELLAEDFVCMAVGALGDADYAVWRHPTCRTMAEQAMVCMRDMPMKYDAQQLVDHYADLTAEGETYRGIWQLTVMVTRINDRTRAVGSDVLDAMAARPRSIDQAEFPFAVARHGARLVDLPGGRGGFWAHHGTSFKLHPHRDGT
jgi:methyltransferase family protein